MRRFIAALAATLMLGLPAAAGADDGLNHVASIFAQRAITVETPTPAEWNTNFFAQGTWGYTFLFSDSVNVAPKVWNGAEHAADPKWPAWQRALGVLVITHESYHLRNWGWAANEGRVECAAIRHFKVAVQLFGGTRADADFLLPYALSIHWRIAGRYPAYNYRNCRVPNYWH